MEGQGSPDSKVDDALVQHRQGPGHSQADGTDADIRWRVELIGAAAAEQLRPCPQPSVNLQPDHRLEPRFTSHFILSYSGALPLPSATHLGILHRGITRGELNVGYRQRDRPGPDSGGLPGVPAPDSGKASSLPGQCRYCPAAAAGDLCGKGIL